MKIETVTSISPFDLRALQTKLNETADYLKGKLAACHDRKTQNILKRDISKAETASLTLTALVLVAGHSMSVDDAAQALSIDNKA